MIRISRVVRVLRRLRQLRHVYIVGALGVARVDVRARYAVGLLIEVKLCQSSYWGLFEEDEKGAAG